MSIDKLRPYSYHSDANIPAFDDSKPLVIFDGKCVLCSSGVQWMIARGPKGEARFAAISEPAPHALYLHYGLDPVAFDTFMVLTDGVPHLRWRGVCAAARLMPAPWKWLGAAGSIVPGFIGDAIYDFVQRNRISWFGSRDVCFVPDGDTRHRFLVSVWGNEPTTGLMPSASPGRDPASLTSAARLCGRGRGRTG